MKKNKLKFNILILILVIFGMTISIGVLAQSGDSKIYNDVIKEKFDDAKEIGLPGTEGYDMTLLDRIAVMINRSLMILAILFLIIIIVGGFKWMTSGGNQEDIEKAKKMLTAGIIGMIIVFFAFGISAFVFNVMFSDYWGK